MMFNRKRLSAEKLVKLKGSVKKVISINKRAQNAKI